MQERVYDLCVIGGGINGAGVARDAAGRGLSVLLVEAGDLAGMTSSASSKMLHGGLRYLEYFEFGLVREALREREVIMNIAPHISRPMDFILPQAKGQRPAWMVKAGLFLYDHLAGRQKLRASGKVDIKDNLYGAPLGEQFRSAFLYADGQVDDARLTVLNAVSASEMGADVLTYTACTHIAPDGGRWKILLEDKVRGGKETVSAARIINAAGPAADKVLALEEGARQDPTAPKLRLVKGSHIVVKKLYQGEHGYIFQNPDGRVIFLWPFEHDFTMIGTTEEEYEGNPREARASAEEIAYLCESVGRVCKMKPALQDVLYSFSGVRPLVDSGRANAGSVSRRHMFHEHEGEGGARMLSIYGGKLTTYRLIAQEAVDKITGEKKHWTHTQPLPGGDVPNGDMRAFIEERTRRYAAFDPALVARYAQAYGTQMDHILGVADDVAGLGEHYGDGIYEAEIRYCIRREFVRRTKDFLWRRSKMDLFADVQTKKNLETAFESLLKKEGIEI